MTDSYQTDIIALDSTESTPTATAHSSLLIAHSPWPNQLDRSASSGSTADALRAGIRVALGAGRGTVLSIVVGQGAKLALIGIVLGIAGSLAVTRFLSAMVYGISTTDAPTFALVAILLGVVAVAASYLPARRAAAADPLEALRAE